MQAASSPITILTGAPMTTDLLAIASPTECYTAFRQAGRHQVPVDTCVGDLFRSAALRAGLTFSDYVAMRVRARHNVIERKAKAQADKTSWRAWFHGVGRKTPNTAAIGLVLISPDGKTLEFKMPIGPASDRLAQYTAIKILLDKAINADIKKIIVFGAADQTIDEINEDLPAPTVATKIFCKLITREIHAFKKIMFISTEQPNPRAAALAELALKDPFDAAATPQAGNLTDVGHLLEQSATTTGRLLNVAGLRSEAKPTSKAFERGIASFTSNSSGISVKWNLNKTAAALEPVARDLGLTRSEPGKANGKSTVTKKPKPRRSKVDDDAPSPRLTGLNNATPKTTSSLVFTDPRD